MIDLNELPPPSEAFLAAWENLFVWALQAEERYLSKPKHDSEVVQDERPRDRAAA